MDEVLARAKKLASAANMVADQMSQQANDYMIITESRRKEEEIQAHKKKQEDTQIDSQKIISKRDIGSSKTFKAAVINGSSLITTYSDVRQFAPRGSVIYIDDNECTLAMKGEWLANRIELSKDYPGTTNLEAIISIPITENLVNSKKEMVKHKAVPVSSEDISSAVQKLDNITYLTPTINTYIVPAPSIQSQSQSQSQTQTTSSSKQSQGSSSPRSPGVNYTTTSSHTSSHIPPSSLQYASMADTSSTSSVYTSFTEASKRSNQSKIPKTLKASSKLRPAVQIPDYRSDLSAISNSLLSSVYEGTGQLSKLGISPVAVPRDIVPPQSIEERKMLIEIREQEVFAPEEIEQRRLDMQQRMAIEGHIRARERAAKWHRKQKRKQQSGEGETGDRYEILDDVTVHSNNKHGDSVYTEEDLEQQRRLAVERVLKKCKEDGEAALRRLEEEECGKAELKAKMEAKAEALKVITQQRVAKIYADKRREERERHQREEEERAERKAREEAQFAEDRLSKIRQLKAETEMRLKQRQEEAQERARREEKDRELRLEQLAEQRGRRDPMCAADMRFQHSDQSQHASGSHKSKAAHGNDGDDDGENCSHAVSVEISMTGYEKPRRVPPLAVGSNHVARMKDLSHGQPQKKRPETHPEKRTGKVRGVNGSSAQGGETGQEQKDQSDTIYLRTKSADEKDRCRKGQKTKQQNNNDNIVDDTSRGSGGGDGGGAVSTRLLPAMYYRPAIPQFSAPPQQQQHIQQLLGGGGCSSNTGADNDSLSDDSLDTFEEELKSPPHKVLPQQQQQRQRQQSLLQSTTRNDYIQSKIQISTSTTINGSTTTSLPSSSLCMSPLTDDGFAAPKTLLLGGGSSSKKGINNTSYDSGAGADGAGGDSNSYMPKIRKPPKNPVWKMAPIPIKPYVQLPASPT